MKEGDADDEREEALAEIVGAWKSHLDRGMPVDPEELVRRNPEFAEEIREAIDLLRALDEEGAPSHGAAPPPSEPKAGPEVGGEPPRGRLGDFRIVREVGRGGMGVVYEAEQISMRRPVALKVLYPSVTHRRQAVERFRREAQATGRLHHTNIVQVHAMGEEAGQWYYAMELVRGRALSEVLADLRRLRGEPPAGDAPPSTTGALSTGAGRREEYVRIARMFAGLADALQTAHEAGIVHRDVKPSNVMLDETARLKILDFGLAAIQQEVSGATLPGDLLGTPAYMSPEQARGLPADRRSDVYSLGATLYEVLTLEPPVRGRDLADTVRRVVSREPVPPRRIDPRIPRDLETIVLKSLAKEPSRRYATAADLGRDLAAFADDRAIAARRAGPLGRAWRWARRHPGRSAAVATVLVSLGAAAYFGILHVRESALAHDREYLALVRRAEEAELHPATEPGQEFADDLYARAIAFAPDRPEAYFLRALTAGAPEARRADLDRAAANGASARSVLLALAYVLRLYGNPKQSLEAEEAARAVGPRRTEDAYLEGVLALQRGELDVAGARFREAVATQPRNGIFHRRALEELSQLQQAAGSVGEAIETLSSAWGNDAMPPRVALRAASLWRRLGRAAEAEERLAHVLATLGTSEGIAGWYEACDVAWRAPEYDWLLRIADLGLVQHPGDPFLVANRAMALAGQGRAAEAVTACRTALDGGAQHSVLLIAYARALRVEGLLEAAVDVGRRALEAAPGSMHARLEHALALHALDRQDAALKTLDEGLALVGGGPATHHWRGRILCRLGRAEEGFEEMRRAVSLAPGDPKYVLGLADALGTAGRAEERLDVLTKALDRFPWGLEIRLTQLGTLTDLGRGEEARAAAETLLLRCNQELLAQPGHAALHPVRVALLGFLDKGLEAVAAAEVACREHPNHADLWTERGVVEVELGRFADAERSLRKALELAPSSTHAQLNLVWVLLQTQRAEEALARCDRVLTQPITGYEGVVASYSRACALQSLGRREDALAAYRHVLALSPTHVDAQVGLAWMRLEGGDLAGAEAMLSGIQGPRAKAHAVRNLRAGILGEQGRDLEALAEVEEALRQAPRNPEYLHNRALILRRLKRFDDALAAYDRLGEVQPLGGEEWMARASILMQLGDAREARDAAVRAVQADPRNAQAHGLLGLAEQALGNLEAAIPQFLEATTLAPGNAGYANVAAWALADCPRADLRDPAKAVALAEGAVQGEPSSASFWNTYGYALLRNGDLAKAVDALRHSARLDQGADPTTGYFLALALARLGKPEEARAALEGPERWWTANAEARGPVERYRTEALEALR